MVTEMSLPSPVDTSGMMASTANCVPSSGSSVGFMSLMLALTADAGTTASDSTRASVTAREQTLAMNVDEYFCIVFLLS